MTSNSWIQHHVTEDSLNRSDCSDSELTRYAVPRHVDSDRAWTPNDASEHEHVRCQVENITWPSQEKLELDGQKVYRNVSVRLTHPTAENPRQFSSVKNACHDFITWQIMTCYSATYHQKDYCVSHDFLARKRRTVMTIVSRGHISVTGMTEIDSWLDVWASIKIRKDKTCRLWNTTNCQRFSFSESSSHQCIITIIM